MATLKCGSIYRNNNYPAPWQGKKRTSMIGKNNWLWKENGVSYSGIHYWIKRQLGKAAHCEFCKLTKNNYQWANKSHEYKRDVSDWISLCVSCHVYFDRYSKPINLLKPKNVCQIQMSN